MAIFFEKNIHWYYLTHSGRTVLRRASIFGGMLLFSSFIKISCQILTNFILYRKDMLINIKILSKSERFLTKSALLCKIEAVSTEMYEVRQV